MRPARTPGGISLSEMVERRLAQIGTEDFLFTAPTAGLLRRGNWGRYVRDRAAEDQHGADAVTLAYTTTRGTTRWRRPLHARTERNPPAD